MQRSRAKIITDTIKKKKLKKYVQGSKRTHKSERCGCDLFDCRPSLFSLRKLLTPLITSSTTSLATFLIWSSMFTTLYVIVRNRYDLYTMVLPEVVCTHKCAELWELSKRSAIDRNQLRLRKGPKGHPLYSRLKVIQIM